MADNCRRLACAEVWQLVAEELPESALKFDAVTCLWKDRQSTRLNSRHTEIYTLSLHDALPIYGRQLSPPGVRGGLAVGRGRAAGVRAEVRRGDVPLERSAEHTSELPSHRDLHSFPTRRSSDLWPTTVAAWRARRFGSWSRKSCRSPR